MLVVGRTIERISTTAIIPPAGMAVTRIEGGGRTLMPGLIDAHTHLVMAEIPLSVVFTSDPNYLALQAGRAATATLMRGFTSVRDVAGPTFGLKRAIDEGVVVGPRIWPSGAAISQTSGHGDFRSPHHDLPRGCEPTLALHGTQGIRRDRGRRPQVLQAVREHLMKGASQIKLMAGGGVASNYDPLDVTQYTEDEMRAAVEAAAAWGTYVTVHAYTPGAIQQAIRAGVRCIEHAQLADEATAKAAAQADVVEHAALPRRRGCSPVS